ncbi:MAG: hypothetical protein GY716_02785 [bacterium]|nr:hypothetical protein [bacterium]
MRISPIALGLALSLSIGAASGRVSAEEPTRVLQAKVTFVTSTSVYVSAGREEQVRIGDTVTILRDGEPVATAEVTDLSTHKSVCKLLESVSPPVAGDAATIEVLQLQPEATPTADKRPPPSRRRVRPGIHGRVGVRWLSVADRGDGGADYSQPALDLRLDADAINGSAWGFDVDVRARRTYRTAADGSSLDDSRTRVYRLAVQHRREDGPWELTLGRHYSPALAVVSVFDGVSARYAGGRWATGFFSGSQPDAEDYGYSGDIREHGAFFQWFNAHESSRRWRLTTGLVGSYEDSEVNREFLYFQGRFRSRRLFGYLTQEVDLNRSWKEDEGEDSISPTSTYATLRYQVNRTVELHAGFDNRRRVRLYRDRITPGTEFDDTYRRGLWFGSSVLLKKRYRLGLDAKTNRRESYDSADSYTARFDVYRMTSRNIDVRTRVSHYTNERVEGQLVSLRVGIDAGSRLRASIGGGARNEELAQGLGQDSTLTWYGIDLDYAVGRSWYVLLSLERTDSDLEQVDYLHTSVSYRF